MTDPASLAAPRLLACPDKFKGTATAAEVAGAIADAAVAAGLESTRLPLSDGGEGLLAVAGGANRSTEVAGPFGSASRVQAAWRHDGDTAIIEMAQAAGLVLAGGAGANNAVKATTFGVGELVLAALENGANRLIIGCGGSATTDGGLGALEAIGSALPTEGVELVVACDVTVGFLEAAAKFGPQKGATPSQITELEARLESLARQYLDRFGVDVTGVAGSGAAGGLAGGLAAVGARLVSGFALVADITGLDQRLAESELVVTGEGRLDEQSFEGKVVGELASRIGVRPAACVAGQCTPEGRRLAETAGFAVLDLTAIFGEQAANAHPLPLVTQVVGDWLSSLR